MPLPITIDVFRHSDISEICSWVLTAEQLRMVSDDVAGGLRGDILLKWASRSTHAVTMRYKGEAVGFCTLTDAEYDYPRGHVEVCHLVVDPKYRRRYFGTTLLNYMRILSAHCGYKVLHGRVVPSNAGSLAFTEYVHWQPSHFSFLDDDFRWFTYELRSITRPQERLPRRA